MRICRPMYVNTYVCKYICMQTYAINTYTHMYLPLYLLYITFCFRGEVCYPIFIKYIDIIHLHELNLAWVFLLI